MRLDNTRRVVWHCRRHRLLRSTALGSLISSISGSTTEVKKLKTWRYKNQRCTSRTYEPRLDGAREPNAIVGGQFVDLVVMWARVRRPQDCSWPENGREGS